MGKPLVIGGDIRADSPGHSAKFGSYTVMDLEHHHILNVESVQICLVDYGMWQNVSIHIQSLYICMHVTFQKKIDTLAKAILLETGRKV